MEHLKVFYFLLNHKQALGLRKDSSAPNLNLTNTYGAKSHFM
jgi:hypothetical protein